MLLKMECMTCPLLVLEEDLEHHYCTYNKERVYDIKNYSCEIESEYLKNEDLATLLEILKEELKCCKNRVLKLEKELTNSKNSDKL